MRSGSECQPLLVVEAPSEVRSFDTQYTILTCGFASLIAAIAERRNQGFGIPLAGRNKLSRSARTEIMRPGVALGTAERSTGEG